VSLGGHGLASDLAFDIRTLTTAFCLLRIAFTPSDLELFKFRPFCAWQQSDWEHHKMQIFTPMR